MYYSNPHSSQNTSLDASRTSIDEADNSRDRYLRHPVHAQPPARGSYGHPVHMQPPEHKSCRNSGHIPPPPHDQERTSHWRNPSKAPRHSTPIRTSRMTESPHCMYKTDRQSKKDETQTTQGDRTPQINMKVDFPWPPHDQKRTTNKKKPYKKTKVTQGDRTPQEVSHSNSQWETDRTEMDSLRSPQYQKPTTNRKPPQKNLFKKTPVHHLSVARELP